MNLHGKDIKIFTAMPTQRWLQRSRLVWAFHWEKVR